MTEQQRLERIRQITPYFAYWQGLKMVPFGVMTLGIGLLFLTQVEGVAFAVLYGALFVAGILLYMVLSGMYRNLFGQVSNPRINRRLDYLTIFAWIPVIWVALALDVWLDWPVKLMGLCFAVFLEWTRAATGGGREYYWGFAALFVLYALCPLLGLSERHEYALLMGVCGVSMIGAGLLDHFELIRVFKPLEEEHEPAA